MTATMGWFVSVLMLLGLVIFLNHLGVDVPSMIGTFVHSTERLLDRPLVTF